VNTTLRRVPLGLILLCGCGAAGAGERADEVHASSGEGSAGTSTEFAANPWPSDQCSWVTPAEVEAVMGPLAGPPVPDEGGGCRYPLPPDEKTLRRLAAARKLGELAKELARREGTTLDTSGNPMPTEPSVTISVSLDAAPMMERALRNMDRIAEAWLESDSLTKIGRTEAKEWDYSQSPIAFGLAGFLGRTGELTVMITNEVMSIPESTLARLAAVVREKVPDRPFGPKAGTPVYSGNASSGPDPCSLLSAEEAAAVLGALVVPPYRILEGSVYPNPAGQSCAYRTAGHRVFRLTPVWSDGRSEMALTRGIGGLISKVMPGESPETADTLEGPWDEAALETSTGAFVFLKGDRALNLAYMSSSTNAGGAVRLARIVLPRLAKAP